MNYKDNKFLDRSGFAPFAEVTSGMDVVDKLVRGIPSFVKRKLLARIWDMCMLSNLSVSHYIDFCVYNFILTWNSTRVMEKVRLMVKVPTRASFNQKGIPTYLQATQSFLSSRSPKSPNKITMKETRLE